MAIIKYSKDLHKDYTQLHELTDQFLSTEQKKDPSWTKSTMDYFANQAFLQYNQNKESFVKNYRLLKGILTPEDFYQEEAVKSYTEMLLGESELPAYVQSYSAMLGPINQLVGEVSKRADQYKAKAFDENSKSEELVYKTNLLQEFIINKAKEKILQSIQESGEEISEEEINERTMKDVQEDLDSYTSIGEKFANKILECQKLDFNMKEKAEDAFRDLAISAREFFLIYEDNSKIGFNTIVVNPKNVWFLTTSDKKYISDVTGRAQGAYAAGTIEVMELSEIIEAFPDLTKEEIDHLRSKSNSYSSSFESKLLGPDSIEYNTYSRLLEQENMFLESEINESIDPTNSIRLSNSNVNNINFGLKFTVIRSYWLSKRKIGRLLYYDELGVIQSMLVDDSYKSKDISTEVSLDWGWVNQWYQGAKIGQEVYHVKPFKLLNYCPLIGTIYESKNTKAKSLVDLMKPFQAVIDLSMNQLWKLLEKEKGRVQLMSLRHIPVPKDGDAQDAIEIWEAEARERGIVFTDDSPENLKSPSSFNQYTVLDLTRTQEIQSRYTLAQQMKIELQNMVGMTPQRLGSVTASESATGTNTALNQSYNQTEPLVVAHEYVMGQVYQAIVDAAIYLKSQEKETTLSFITSEGEAAFLQVLGEDLKLRDIKIYLTNRREDTEVFNKMQALAQSILQNGGSVYDVLELHTNKSVRHIKKIFKDIKEKQDAQYARNQELEQQKVDQLTQQTQILEQANLIAEQKIVNENYQNDLDRLNKKEVAAINASGRNENALADNNKDGVADALALSTLDNERSKVNTAYEIKMKEIQAKILDSNNKKEIEAQKRQVERENMQNDLAVAKTNAQNRTSKK